MTTTQTERSTGGRIEVVGNIWQPGVGLCAMTYTLRPYDVGNMRGVRSGGQNITRDDVEHWVALNSGDFQNVTDFRAVIDDGPLPACDSCGHVKRRALVFDWENEENESAFLDATFGTEEAMAQLESIREMVAALEKADADGTEEERDDARQTIEEDALSVEVRSDWHEPGGDSDPGEYCILLCTGGPAVRIIGRLGTFSEPESARLQYQDWFTEWQELILSHEDYETLLTYARSFYFRG